MILSGKALPKRTCQKIAREVNLPVICFVCKVNEDFKVRFFTPLNEIKVCGHGAIAVIHNLIEDKLITVSKPKTFFKLKTFTKTLEVETFFEKNAVKVVWVNFGKPTFLKSKVSLTKIAKALQVGPNKITDLPIEKISLGTRKVMVPLNTMEVLNEIDPKPKTVVDFCREENVTGIHAFTLDTLGMKETAHARHFSLAEGGIEDFVSGVVNGALGCYLVKNGIVKSKKGITNIVVKQGKLGGRIGDVFVKIAMNGNAITAVKVGGKAVTVFKGEICV